MNFAILLSIALSVVTSAYCKVYFEDKFENGKSQMHHSAAAIDWNFFLPNVPSVIVDWENDWINTEHAARYGKFVRSAGKFYNDIDKDQGKFQSQMSTPYEV